MIKQELIIKFPYIWVLPEQRAVVRKTSKGYRLIIGNSPKGLLQELSCCFEGIARVYEMRTYIIQLRGRELPSFEYETKFRCDEEAQTRALEIVDRIKNSAFEFVVLWHRNGSTFVVMDEYSTKYSTKLP